MARTDDKEYVVWVKSHSKAGRHPDWTVDLSWDDLKTAKRRADYMKDIFMVKVVDSKGKVVYGEGSK